MTSRLNPYLNFSTTARQAMEFYRDVFGGELQVMTFGDFGSEPADGVMHAQLETPAGYTLMAADAPAGQNVGEGGPISISVSGDDDQELRGYFEKLADGGTVVAPLEKQAWGDTFGMCVDRFGIGWMVDITHP